ncbi:hypothetical protein [Halopenitus persicus]|uniref:hypothetical protein n=1 Tax=Halopenitus persicus TaxID=1048396 RepID=UPI0012FDA6D8|nr:hypothetical protein [Halopenitus persicus]
MAKREVGGVGLSLEDVENELSTVRGTVNNLTLTTSELSSMIEKRSERMDGKQEVILEKQRRTRRLQERTWVDNTWENGRDLAEVVTFTGESIKTDFRKAGSIFGLRG